MVSPYGRRRTLPQRPGFADAHCESKEAPKALRIGWALTMQNGNIGLIVFEEGLKPG